MPFCVPIQLIIQYDPLMLRYARRLLRGKSRLADDIVKVAMEECYAAGEFTATPALRSNLKNRVRAKVKEYIATSQIKPTVV